MLGEDTIIVVVILYKEEQFEKTKEAIRSRKFKWNRPLPKRKTIKRQTKIYKILHIKLSRTQTPLKHWG